MTGYHRSAEQIQYHRRPGPPVGTSGRIVRMVRGRAVVVAELW